AHGVPVQIGDAAGLGIRDLDRPDFGDAVEIRPGEVPVFWACGVTPQAALIESKIPFAITHAPGHMFITDVPEVGYRSGG
ncbi:D-glutamate cyclase family protein, partial [Actinophytocola sp.]|uniref:D-glutamate cyclase family protein n=1 Tax=Actinophytocola sp. TaxID=1872138 RepID=UPI002D80CC99